MSLTPEFKDELWERDTRVVVLPVPRAVPRPARPVPRCPVTSGTGAELTPTGLLSSLASSPTPPPAPRAGAELAHRPPSPPHSPHWRMTFWFSSAQMGGRLGFSEDRASGFHRRRCPHSGFHLLVTALVAPEVSRGKPAAACDLKWDGWGSSHSPRDTSHLQAPGGGSCCPQTLEAELRFLTRREAEF